MSNLFLERSVEDETVIIEGKQKSPCFSCRHSSKKNDDYCYSRCVGKPDCPGYEPHNQTYDYRKFYDKEASDYAKLIVRERIITRHRFPMDNFEYDIIPEDAYKDIKLEDLV